MARVVAWPLALLAYYTSQTVFAARIEPQPYQQIVSLTSKINIRPATVLDLDDITTVVVDAFSPGPLYHYVYPEYDKFKKYHWKCARKEAGRQLADMTENDFANVITVPFNDQTNDDRRERVVAVAFWSIMKPTGDGVHPRSVKSLSAYLGSASCEDHLDTNMTRALDFVKQFSAAEEHYIDDYPEKQLYLGVLATHPDWDGLGFGAAQCRWGLAMAAEMRVTTTLIATPAGWPLYNELGFESTANITIKTIDEPDNLWFEYMRYSS